MKTRNAALPRSMLILALAALALGCARKHQDVKEMTIEQLAELQKTKSVVPLDVNDDDFRKKNGVIPGAILLSSGTKYDFAQLPADKSSKLTFYCSSRT